MDCLHVLFPNLFSMTSFLRFPLLARFVALTGLLGVLVPGMAQTVGDTVYVQTFSLADQAPPDVYRGTFQFPDTAQSFEKILMYYTLKCDGSTQADGYPCGEWDYLSYTYLVDSAGVMDSTFRSNRNYTIGTGQTPDSLQIAFEPSWSYYQEMQDYLVYTDTLSLTTATVGSGNTASTLPFATSAITGRTQYLWRSSELTTAGLAAGDITGMQLDLSTLGSEVRNLDILIKHTPLDTLSEALYEQTGFTEVYHLNTQFAASGWQSLAFLQPFTWDGTSNIVVEFRYENLNPGTDSETQAEQLPWTSGIYSAGNDHYLDFDGAGDYLNLGQGTHQITGNAPRTIEAWAYAEAFNGGGIFQAGPTGSTGRDFSMRTMGTDNQWRIQLWGTPDFDVTLPGSKDSWHHYCVSFDGNAARVYYDGQLVTTRTISINTGINDFWIGRWAGSFFNGKIDEIRVWDKALDAATIAAWQDHSLTPSHPDYAHLMAYYPIDEGNGFVVNDQSVNGHTGSLVGIPDWRRLEADQLRIDLTTTAMRPNTRFEQGVFTSSVQSLLAVDSLQNTPVQLILYNNPSGPYIIADDAPNHPSIPTDTLYAWQANTYSFTFDTQGTILDSTYIAVDSTLYRDDHEYYSNIVRYELLRFITPYGINLDLGDDGFTWVFDVTDYAPLLHDWVYLQAGNNQELLDLRFAMIKGTPPREVQKIENVYNGNWTYAAIWNETQAAPTTKTLSLTGNSWRIKTRTSGHGFGGPSNCAEFCPKVHSIDLNNSPAFSWSVWNECSTNPVYPQGGTWIYDRAGWCPGAEVTTFDHELPSTYKPGDAITIDYDISAPNAVGPEGNYVLATQLVTYGPPNYVLDAEISAIISPNNADEYGRRNPICDGPVVRIRNNGTTPLTSLLFTYGVEDGFMPCSYYWTGNLGFLESQEVKLPLFNWTGLDQGDPVFWVMIDEPNGGVDQNTENNYQEAAFTVPPQYPGTLTLEIGTNNAGAENGFKILDASGNIMAQQLALGNNQTYLFPLTLADGCYTFHFTDSGQDGIAWWANNDGNGYVRFLNPDGTFAKAFEPDYGNDIWHQFTVGYKMGQEPPTITCATNVSNEPLLPQVGLAVKVYPNPAQDRFFVELELEHAEDIEISIFNPLGINVFTSRYFQQRSGAIELQSPDSPGLYLIQVRSSSGLRTAMPLLITQ